MSYRTRSARKLAQKSRKNFIITLILIGFIFFATLNWVLPNFINGIGFVKETIKPAQKEKSILEENPLLAAPVLNIPFEATSNSEIEIKGAATPNSKIILYVDDQNVKETQADENGLFTFQNVSLSIGTNNIYAKSVDDQSRESLPSKTVKVIFDNEKPQLTISEPEDDKKIQGGDKRVKISGKTEPGSKILINDSQVIVDKDGNFSIDQLLNEGENMIIIKSVDLANNTTEIQRKVTYTP